MILEKAISTLILARKITTMFCSIQYFLPPLCSINIDDHSTIYQTTALSLHPSQLWSTEVECKSGQSLQSNAILLVISIISIIIRLLIDCIIMQLCRSHDNSI